MQDSNDRVCVPASTATAETPPPLPNELWVNILSMVRKNHQQDYQRQVALARKQERDKRWCPRCKVSPTDPQIGPDRNRTTFCGEMKGALGLLIVIVTIFGIVRMFAKIQEAIMR